MKYFKLGRKGQSNIISLGYAFILFFASIFILGGLLIIISETTLGVYMHQYALDYGLDATVLSQMEWLRGLLPFAVLINMGLGLIALSNILSTYGG